MTLLSIVQAAIDEIGDQDAPTSVIGNTDPEVTKALRRMDKIGRFLVREYEWQELKKEHTFNALTDQAGTSTRCAYYALPSDFQRIISLTQWDRTAYDRVYGPATDAEWELAISGLTVSSLDSWWMIAGDYFWITPTPTASATLAYRYRSNAYCKSSGGTWQTAWAADTDLPILDQEIFILGLVWELKRSKGLPSDAEQAAFFSAINSPSESGGRAVNFGGGARPMPMRGNIPDTGAGA